jgi:hypothetical protein
LTEIGPDIEALRSEDRPGILFDLGLGLLQVDAFVRISDPTVASALRRHVGKSVFATDSGAMAVILDANPHRVFVSSAGRVEVFQGIPPPNGKSPEGPPGRIPQLTHYQAIGCRAYCYPPHPIRDGQGRSHPFDANSHFAFQAILERYGDAEHVALKKHLISAVMAGDEPFAIKPNGDRFRRATARVTLRQLQASGAQLATLAAWLAAYDRAERVE